MNRPVNSRAGAAGAHAIRYTVAALVAAASAWSAGAWAQQAPAAPRDDDLQEVVITAERRTENVQTTPIAVNVLSGDQLLEQHVGSALDLEKVAPISVTNSGWHQQVNIRGIGNSVISASVNIGVAMIRDGLFEAETLGQSEPMYDIASTEVLRGPQGTFVGYSSTGGAVMVNSASPKIGDFSGYLQSNLGTYSDVALQGAVNLPISDTFAARIAFNNETRNSFYRFVNGVKTAGVSQSLVDPGNLNNKQARLTLLWKPSDSFQAQLKSAYSLEKTDGLASQVDQGMYTDPLTGTVINAPYYAQSTHQPFVLNADRIDQLYNQAKLATGLELKYTLPNGITLRSMSGYEKISLDLIQDSDATFMTDQWQFRSLPNNTYMSQEFNVISPADAPLTWLVGSTVFYRNTPVNSTTYIATAGTASLAFPNQTIGATHSIQRIGGLFGQVGWKFAPKWELQVGARENWDSNYNRGTSINRSVNNAANPTGYRADRVSSSDTPTYTDSVPTGKIDINYEPAPGQFLYAFWARGYKSGGYNATSRTNFEPEKVDDFELGWKGSLLDNHLQAQVGGYWMKYGNYQYSLINPVTGTSDVSNMPTATIKGVEVSFQAKLGNWSANAGIYYNKSALGALNAIANYKLPPTLASNTPGCSATVTTGCFNYGPYLTNVSGETNAFSPPLTMNGDIGYSIHIGDGVLKPKISYSHTDKQYGSIFQNDTYWLMGSRDLLGADLSYTKGKWLVNLYGTNLGDKTYVSGFYGAGGRLNDVFYGAPRQYGLRLNYQF